MKKLLLIICLAFMGVNAMAQYSNPIPDEEKKPVDIRGSRVYVDKKKLNKEQAALCFSSVDGIDRSRDYLKYRAGYKTGLGLTFGGLALAATGYVTTSFGLVVGLAKAFTDQSIVGETVAIYLGIGSMCAGAACFVSGIPIACVYRARLNKLEKAHNASLEVKATSNGMALSISF